ncbi:MAG: MinD/ParA family protein [Treponema sp.]|nr:MinD/ParA family protein [Treponema sp.]
MIDQAEELREIMRKKRYGSSLLFSASRSNRNNSILQSSNEPRLNIEKKKNRIITITSGKGGVGKTNLSVNMAVAFARIGKKVVIMDADLGLGNVNVMLNIIPRHNLYHVIKKQMSFRDIILETEYGFSIVPGVSGFSQIANMDKQERLFFIEELEAALSFADIVIIDTGAGVSSNVMDFIAAADDAIIITTPEPTAITDAYGIIKIIAMEYNLFNLSLKLVVNRTRGSAEAKSVANNMIKTIGQYLYMKVDYLGFIYDDPAIPSAVRHQRPLMIIDPKSKASICIQHMAERIDKNLPEETGGIGSMLKKIFNRS